ncbi:MAG: MtnX-like HAD-IB family phosphatase [Armatimonadota bacterium]
MHLSIVCDFDGTIAQADTNREILERFADPVWLDLEDMWLKGELGSRQCIEGQFALVRASQQDVLSALDGIAVDPHFAEFSSFCQVQNIPLIIASDGMDVSICHILSRASQCNIPTFCNELLFLDGGRVQVRFPHANPTCRSSSGACKCGIVQKRLPKDSMKLLVGDGRSDFCVAHNVDLVLAKDALLDYCRREGLPHVEYRNFADVLVVVRNLLRDP